MASQLPRRQALKLIAATLAGTALSTTFTSHGYAAQPADACSGDYFMDFFAPGGLSVCAGADSQSAVDAARKRVEQIACNIPCSGGCDKDDEVCSSKSDTGDASAYTAEINHFGHCHDRTLIAYSVSINGHISVKCGCECAPKSTHPAIALESFTATATDKSVNLAWQTGSEVDNAGFNLYRASSAAGPYTQINKSLIAADGDPVSGAAYSFTDAPGNGTFFYKLEDVDIHDVSTLHDPVTAHIGPEGSSSGNGNNLFLPFAEK